MAAWLSNGLSIAGFLYHPEGLQIDLDIPVDAAPGPGHNAPWHASGLSIAIDNGADMLALEGGGDPFWDPPIDNLKLVQESSMVKQIEQDPFERQGLKVTLSSIQ